MTTPSEQVTFGENVARFSALLAQWTDTVSRCLVMEVTGSGPTTLTDDLHGGKRLRISNGTSTNPIVCNLGPDEPLGTTILWRQTGPAPIKFQVLGGATLQHRLGHNASAGQQAGGSVTVESIQAGKSVWWIDGDTAQL